MPIKNSRILSGLFSIGIGEIGGYAIGMAFWFLIAGILEPAKFGELAFFMGIAAVSSTIALLGAGNSLVVLISKKVPIISSFSFFSLIISIGMALALSIIFLRIDVGLVIISLTIGVIGTSILTGKHQYKKFAIYHLIQKILLLTSALVIYFIFEKDFFLLSVGISYLVFLPVFINGFKESKINKNIFWKEKKFIFTNYVSTLFGIFLRDVDKFIVPAILGMATLGQFSLSVQIYAGMMIIPLIVNRFMMAEESAKRNTGKVFKYALTIQTIVGVSAMILLPDLIPNFFPKYIETVEIIPIVALSIIPGTLFSLLSAKIIARKNNKLLLSSSAIQMITITAGLLIFGSILGPIGLGIAHLLSYSVASLVLLMFSKKAIFENT
tara:strand:+ start:1668 stop:2813 length:1146 start_codon:yes stop_codon:yes gene_type:complete